MKNEKQVEAFMAIKSQWKLGSAKNDDSLRLIVEEFSTQKDVQEKRYERIEGLTKTHLTLRNIIKQEASIGSPVDLSASSILRFQVRIDKGSQVVKKEIIFALAEKTNKKEIGVCPYWRLPDEYKDRQRDERSDTENQTE